jgi:hypothetical protein
MKHLNHCSFLLLILIFFSACSPQTAQSQRKNRNNRNQPVVKPKPEWVTSRPITSQFYVGIGYSSTRTANYQQAAKNNAFEDLLSEIKVNISSTSVLYQMDKKSTFRDEYESTIKSTVKNEIEDFEVVDSYENPQEAGYWVYYRLSKSKYAEQKRKKVQTATAIASDFFQKAQNAEQQGLTATAIDFYAKTILALKDYWAENIQADLQGKSVMLSNESYTRIQQILDGIVISTPSASIQLRKQTSQAPSVPLRVSYNNQAQRSMPILATYIRNRQEYTTTEKGEISVLLDKISGVRNSFTLNLSLDLSKIISGNNEDKFYKFLLTSFRSPSQTVTINLAKPTIFIASDEKNLGVPQRAMLLSNQLRSALTNRGYTFVNNRNQAEVILEVEADTRKGNEANGIFFAFLSMNVRAIDVQTGQEIFNETMPEVKGGQTSFERAGTDAYQKAARNVDIEIASKLAEVL